MTHHIAQLNVGILVAPPGDERVAPFVDALDEINALADAAPGFVWRLQSDSGNALDIRVFDDPSVALNMSVWESIEALHHYAYRTAHVDFFKRRAEWFEPPTEPGTVLWWVPAGHIPTPEEGAERLQQLRQEGPTPAAFTFAKRFDP